MFRVFLKPYLLFKKILVKRKRRNFIQDQYQLEYYHRYFYDMNFDIDKIEALVNLLNNLPEIHDMRLLKDNTIKVSLFTKSSQSALELVLSNKTSKQEMEDSKMIHLDEPKPCSFYQWISNTQSFNDFFEVIFDLLHKTIIKESDSYSRESGLVTEYEIDVIDSLLFRYLIIDMITLTRFLLGRYIDEQQANEDQRKRSHT